MRRLLLLVISLFIANVAYAQVTGTVVPGFVFPGLPSLGSTTSALDHNGNLLIFDVTYSAPTTVTGATVRVLPTAKTRLTVVTADGAVMPSVQYEGAFQVIGAGWFAVYALENAYSAGPTFAPSRRLLAFNVVAGVPLAPLPGVDVPIRAEVKLAPSTDRTVPDRLSFVDPGVSPLILAPPGTTAPVVRRNVQIVKYSGGTSFDVGKPVPLP